MLKYLLRYEPIRALLKYEPVTNIVSAVPINHDDFKNELFDHLQKCIHTKKYTNKTASYIHDRCKTINCLICLDVKHLWVARPFVTTFDNQGNYEILNCYHCSDGAFHNYSDTNFIIENGVRMFEYNKPSYETTIHQLQIVDENLPLWNLCKDKIVSNTIYEATAHIDINKLSVDVAELIQGHLGNIVSLNSFIKTFDGELKYLYYNDHSKNECYEQISDEQGKIYIMMEMEKQCIEGDASCGVLRMTGKYKECHLYVRYTISVPRNKSAEKKCDEWFNNRVTQIMSAKLDRRL
jgi:hypothetical protein